MFAAVWLAFLVGPAIDLWNRGNPLALELAGTTLIVGFVLVYLWGVAQPFGPQERRGTSVWWVPLGLLTAALLLLPLTGESGLAYLVFVAVTCQSVWSIWRAVLGSLAVVVLTMVLAEVVPGWSGDGLGIAISVLAASMAMFGVVRMAERNAALVCAQEERARLAVVEERERFGRDLHDILGHSLTVIAMKSELAGRLVVGDPERAAAEIADVERLAREALADVRHTVAGVREVTLVGELSAARTALLAAGIEPDLPNAVDEVPGELRETYGYVVREAVTNVVRHSGASRCTVRAGAWGLEVVDDGPASGHGGTGQGLVGLRARVHAAGLHFSAAPLAGRGFRVAATVAAATPDGSAAVTGHPSYGRPRPATT